MSEDQYLVYGVICAISFVYGAYKRNKELEGPDSW